MTVKPVKTIQNQVYEIIKANISSGTYQPNQRLQEVEIASELNVSRSPVREAFRELTAEGLLVALPNKGVYVKEFSKKDFQDIFELRILIETHAIRKLTEATISEMTMRFARIREAMRFASHMNDIELYVKTDADFHQMLVENSGNELLATTYNRAITMVRHSIHYALRAPERLNGVEDEHTAIMQLLLEGKFEEAAQANEYHLNRTCEVLIVEVFGGKAD